MTSQRAFDKIRARSKRLAEALLHCRHHKDGLTRVYRARNGAWVMVHQRTLIAVWNPKAERLQVALTNDGTIVDRINAISILLLREIWLTPVKTSNYYSAAYVMQYKFRGRHEITSGSTMTFTNISGKLLHR